MAINFPNPATQNPVNTFSPTSTPAASTNNTVYVWNGSAWRTSAFAESASDRVFQLNTMTVSSDFTLPGAESSLSAGPITINDGVVVTIPNNQNWVIL